MDWAQRSNASEKGRHGADESARDALASPQEATLIHPHATRRVRSRSAPLRPPSPAPDWVSTPLVRLPPLPPAALPRIVTGHSSPPTTLAPSNLSPNNAAAPSAFMRRPSTPPTMSKSAVPDERDGNARRARKLGRHLGKILLERTRVDYQQASLMHNLRFLDESVEALSAALWSSDLAESAPERVQKVSELQLQFRSDYEAVRGQTETLRGLQNNLNTLEYRLQHKEKALADAITSLAGHLPPDADEADSSEGHEVASAVSDIPTLLRDFYRRKGDVGIFLERLDGNDQAYRDARAERELVADRGEELLITDEQFEREYSTQHEQILSDLIEAEADIVRLQLLCGQAGLEITNVRPSSLFDRSSSARNSEPEDPTPPPPIGGGFLHTFDMQEGFLAAPGAAAQTIQGWLNEVSGEPTEPREIYDTEPEVVSAREVTIEDRVKSISPLQMTSTTTLLSPDKSVDVAEEMAIDGSPPQELPREAEASEHTGPPESQDLPHKEIPVQELPTTT
ncbi:hypothetical protein LTR53_005362 [Teratosphaeriaceae sp. CCFEE 6253]|nr:hypothetical protein LTR53_005362 [Teratosphaeriaceae sp. CCFEE 6253]